MLIIRKKAWIVVFVVGLSLIAGGVVWAAGGGFTDTTISDFNAGTVGSCLVSPSATNASGDGEVVLGLGTGGMLETFSGTTLTNTWSSGSYGGGSLTVNNGLTVDGYWAASNSTVTAPRVLEFVATFSSTVQHVGFGADQTLNSFTPWALFSTRGPSTDGDQLYARTLAITQTWTPLGTTYFGSPHRYRIEWTSTQVNYYIDGSLKATDAAVPISTTAMYPVVSDPVPDGIPLVVDWMQMGDYISNCTFESRSFNANTANPTWGQLTATTSLPTGTNMTFNTRTSQDGLTNWSPWAALGTGNAITSPSDQYIQYQAILTTTVSQYTPVIASVLITGTGPTAVTMSTFSGHTSPTGDSLPLALIVVGMVLAVIVVKARPSSSAS